MPSQETFWFLDGLMRVHAASEKAGDGISVIEHTLPFGSSPPLHVHHTEDEIFHILEGEVHFRVDGVDVHARAGETVVAPKGKPHSFMVTSPQGARWLVMTGRGDFERMVRSVGRPADDERLPPNVPPTQAEIAALEAACNAHSITLLGPPLAQTVNQAAA